MVWFYLDVRDLFNELIYKRRWYNAFNPTMVWFYQIYIIVVKQNEKSFQSHYGLILSYGYLSWVNEAGTVSTFQSHYGLILSFCTRRGVRSGHSTFQSHYGLILSRYSKRGKVYPSTLSIPLWSDFINPWWRLRLLRKTPFNPTMVWFYLVVIAW